DWDPVPIDAASGIGRVVASGRSVHIHDVHEDPFYGPRWALDAATLRGTQMAETRTFLLVPLKRNELVVGAFLMRRIRVQPFTVDEIRLVETFADQAVIAMENARLFSETKQ